MLGVLNNGSGYDLTTVRTTSFLVNILSLHCSAMLHSMPGRLSVQDGHIAAEVAVAG